LSSADAVKNLQGFAFSAGSPETVGELLGARGERGAALRIDRFSASHSCGAVFLFRSLSSIQRSSRTSLFDFTTGDFRWAHGISPAPGLRERLESKTWWNAAENSFRMLRAIAQSSETAAFLSFFAP
jgi:hypothetical protein